MIDWFLELSAIKQALIAGMFTWALTAIGALPVLFLRSFNRRIMKVMLGFAGGVMVAASCWSLLIPAIEKAADMQLPMLLHVGGSFFAGGMLMLVGDVIMRTAMPTGSDRCGRLLLFSITLHNIPEGLCIGVAFGALASGSVHTAGITSACMLALGIGLQNLPEGAAVSLPMLRSGMSRLRAFNAGQRSAIVEPVAAVIGALLVTYVSTLLPAILAFAAGAMIFVVAGEIFPESRDEGRTGIPAMAAIAGFAIMMSMDVMLG